MKKDLRLMALLPVASVGCLVLNALDMLAEAIELRYSDSLNGPDDDA